VKLTARILSWLATAVLTFVLLGTIWLWDRSYSIADAWLYNAGPGEMRHTPGSWLWGLVCERGCFVFDRSFSGPHDPGIVHREYAPLHALRPQASATWLQRLGFYFDRGPGWAMLAFPCWLIVLLAGPLPLWRAWRWVSGPWRRKVRGFDVQLNSEGSG
jgi:hypothetical protein